MSKYVIESWRCGYIKKYKYIGFCKVTGYHYDITYTDKIEEAKKYTRRGSALSAIERIYDYYEQLEHSCDLVEVDDE